MAVENAIFVYRQGEKVKKVSDETTQNTDHDQGAFFYQKSTTLIYYFWGFLNSRDSHKILRKTINVKVYFWQLQSFVLKQKSSRDACASAV